MRCWRDEKVLNALEEDEIEARLEGISMGILGWCGEEDGDYNTLHINLKKY